MEIREILEKLPYKDPFLFVDGLDEVTPEGIKGRYQFRESAAFYRGHFKDNPVTPGVLLTECCAQIGLVCLGLYLITREGEGTGSFVMSSSDMQFLLPVLPGETVQVQSKKLYFRFNKLKCEVKMYNHIGDVVCEGVIAGMLIQEKYE